MTSSIRSSSFGRGNLKIICEVHNLYETLKIGFMGKRLNKVTTQLC